MVLEIVLWNTAETVSSLVLLGALALMAKYYSGVEDEDVDGYSWKLAVIGFAFYIGVKAHFTMLSAAADLTVAAYPPVAVVLVGGTMILSAFIAFMGFYRMVEDDLAF